MKDQVRIDWIAALRSGDFTQGFDQLADKDGNYCCLGVLCELAVRDGVTTKARVVARTEEERAAELEADELEDHYYDIDYDGDVSDSFKCADIEVPVGSWFYLDGAKRPIGGELPMEVREWAGINDNTRIKFLDFGGGLFATLAEANDSHRLTFTQIADAIEKMDEEPQGQDPEDQDE